MFSISIPNWWTDIFYCVGLSAQKLAFSLTQRQSMVPISNWVVISTTFDGVACSGWILSWDGL